MKKRKKNANIFFVLSIRILSIVLLLCAFVVNVRAQNLQNDEKKSWIDADEKTIIEYDAATQKYVFYHLNGGQKTYPYKIMDVDEFQRYQIQNSIRNAWVEKRDTDRRDAKEQRKSLLSARTRVKNNAFGDIFGNDFISINPQGSAEMVFSVNRTKNTNPLLTENFRTSTDFAFDTKLQLNVQGTIGNKVNVDFNYNTESTFDFEKQFKVTYSGDEDEILQRIEAGNISFPLNGTLIQGAQGLFGLRTDLKFGRLTLSGLIAKQQSESKKLEIKGGAQISDFEIGADEYDANRHFFLSQYFKDNYDKALRNLPYILSGITITKIEVWVTNKTSNFDNSRSIVGFIDLGEPSTLYQNRFRKASPPRFPANDANNLLNVLNVANFRAVSDVTSYLGSNSMVSGTDYEKLENARKLIQGADYTLNSSLGYISLNSALNNDEVLAVAYEYTANGIAYKVGEISTDGVISPNVLVAKLLKGTNLTPKLPTWQLMMKNIYTISSTQFSNTDFILDAYYQDDNAGTSLTYLPEGAIKEKPLISVLNADQLNSANAAQPDGRYDFVDGVTVLADKGRIIFPVLEPFGRYLESKINNAAIAQKYVFKELYDSTLVRAKENAERNKFKLAGTYKSENSSEIMLNASNIPEGSVVVTVGGVKLTENVDYSVNYAMGTVKIINSAYLQSGMTLNVSLEDNSLFSLQQKTMYGLHANYEISKDFNIGATYLGLHERAMTRKVSFGEDPISNSVFGLDLSYRKEAPFLTKLVNAVPLLNTREASYISVDAEYAKLFSGQSNKNSYIDDFEAATAAIDLRSFSAWTLASTPQNQSDLFPEGNLSNDISYGFNRSKFAWYSISTDFLRNTDYTPAYIKANPGAYRANHFVREIPVTELFPDKEITAGTSQYISTLNMAFYPRERGPYNYDVANVGSDGLFTNPEKRWGGIMRALTVTDFETANYDHIEFWLMDPFVYNTNGSGGDLYFNLGNISEDVLRDGVKSFEQGLPYPFDASKVVETAWGRMPTVQSLVYSFDNNVAARPYQDVGFDGLKDDDESLYFESKYSFIGNLSGLNATAFAKIQADPSSDNFKHYLDNSFNDTQAQILDRYKDYNNPEGNSQLPEQTGGQTRMSTTTPDMEDINHDNTMNESESYFQYRVKLSPSEMAVGKNYITDVREVEVDFKNNGGISKVRWYQFKIPLGEYQKEVGDISDFKSIRFMRMFMRNFRDETFLRFASLELVRSDWRTYNYSFIQQPDGSQQATAPNAGFETSTVNLEENSSRSPVNYVMPPGVKRENDYSNYQTIQMNEQAMQIQVTDLADGESRGAYKSALMDFRQFKRIIMDVHAEALPNITLNNGDVSVFVRLGSDLKNNYYEYEIPLSLTPYGTNYNNSNDADREIVWPQSNRMDISLETFTNLKLERNKDVRDNGGSKSKIYSKADGANTARIIGTPNLGEIKMMMIGVRNPKRGSGGADDGQDKSAVVWVNEFRLSEYENENGWAATARASAQLADFATITLTGTLMSAGYGSIDQNYASRLQQDVKEYSVVSNFELGKFFPEKWGVKIPFFFGYSSHYETPKYNPFDKDIKLKDALDELSGAARDSLNYMAKTYVQQKSINFSNVRVVPQGHDTPKVFDIANFAFGYSYSKQFKRNASVAGDLQENYSGLLSYAYNVQPKYWQPFKKLKGSGLAFFRDLNINPYPNQFAFSSQISRYYSELTTRNITAPDVAIPTTYSKDFTWERNYALVYDLTRNLRIDFSATNIARIDEPEGMVNKDRNPDGYRHWRDSVWSSFKNFGRNVQYDHTLQLTWNVPFNRISALNWLSTQASYKTGYEWLAATNTDIEDYDPGNVISNTQNIEINSSASMLNLYNKIPLLRRINNEFDGKPQKREMKDVKYESARLKFYAKKRRTIVHKLHTQNVNVKLYDADGNEIYGKIEILDSNRISVVFEEAKNDVFVAVNGKVAKPQPALNYTAKLLARIAMSLRTINVSVTRQGATTLPGYKGGSSFLGMSRYNGSLSPGWAFIFGRQSLDFIENARGKNWLTTDTAFYEPYLMSQTLNLTLRARLEPIKNLNIDVTAQRQHTTNHVQYNVVNPNGLKQEMGSFAVTVVSLGSAFENPKASNGYKSKAFEKFLSIRPQVAWNLAGRRAAKSPAYNPGTGTYPSGYGEFSQDVLVNSFLAAYTGQSASSKFTDFRKIPLPNWTLTYTGLSRIPALKKYLNSATIQHSYKSVYSINSYATNQLYDESPDGLSYVRNALNDFISHREMTNVSLREAMNPLIKIDLSFKNMLLLNFEHIRTRTIALSLANNQITEARTMQYVFGAGYMFRNIPLLFDFGGLAGRNPKSTLRLKGDFSLREDLSIIRKIDAADIYSQIGDGRKIVFFTATADYAIGDRINLRLFYEHQLNEPYVSSISTTNTSVGFSLKVNFGGK